MTCGDSCSILGVRSISYYQWLNTVRWSRDWSLHGGVPRCTNLRWNLMVTGLEPNTDRAHRNSIQLKCFHSLSLSLTHTARDTKTSITVASTQSFATTQRLGAADWKLFCNTVRCTTEPCYKTVFSLIMQLLSSVWLCRWQKMGIRRAEPLDYGPK